MYDIAIIGAGPAGMSAAIYGRRAGLEVVIFEPELPGGQMLLTPDIDNYPGFEHISGAELALSMSEQMKALGAVLVEARIAQVKKGEYFTLVTDGGERYQARTVIISNGAERRKLGIEGEESFLGRGVSYCAVCDGNFFRGKTAVVVGGGNTALEDAVYLSGICKKVYLVHRRDTFRAQNHLIRKVSECENIEVIYSMTPTLIKGEAKVSSVVLSGKAGEREIETDAVFVAIGLEPKNEIFSGLVALGNGYVAANSDTHTSCDGIFAAGDTRTKPLRQVVTAVADGAMAATEAERFLHSI